MSLSEDEQHRVGEIESLPAAADPRFARRLDLSTAAATAAASGRCGGVARTHQRRWRTGCGGGPYRSRAGEPGSTRSASFRITLIACGDPSLGPPSPGRRR